MKKLSMLLVLALVLSLLAGCAGTPVIYYTDCTCPTGSHNTPVETKPVETKPAETTAPVEGALKTGLAIVASAGESASAGEKDGEAKYDVTVVAVLVDDNGVIVDCILDSIGTSVKFDTTGAITSDLSAAVLTKNELGDAYNMKTWGGAIAEWYEQAAALADFAVGKTIEELKSGAIDASGYAPDGSDLRSSATIYLGGYVSAIEAAVASAQHLGAQGGDELKLAITASVASSAAATAEKAGTAQLDVDAAAVTVKGDVITSCFIDSLQGKVSFDATGAIGDVSAPLQTKNQLGDAYNMKTWGGAIAEWNEQAASFCAYITGKTLAEVQGIAVDAGTKPTDADLTSSVTIAIGGFQALIAKALQQ